MLWLLLVVVVLFEGRHGSILDGNVMEAMLRWLCVVAVAFLSFDVVDDDDDGWFDDGIL